MRHPQSPKLHSGETWQLVEVSTARISSTLHCTVVLTRHPSQQGPTPTVSYAPVEKDNSATDSRGGICAGASNLARSPPPASVVAYEAALSPAREAPQAAASPLEEQERQDAAVRADQQMQDALASLSPSKKR